MSSSKFTKYSSYKDSGQTWLGNVPTHWDLKRVGYYFDERRQKVSDKDFPPLSVTKNGIVPQLDNAAKSDDGDNRKLVKQGDFVINSRSDRKGSSGLSQLDGSVSLINTVITPSSALNTSYIHHLFRSVPFQEEYYRFGKGIVADLWSTNYSEFKNIVIPIPSESEQNRIAKFLNDETLKVDELIREQENLIALLIEKKTSIISGAVTHGLDPAMKRKKSGINWLGDIPESWDLVPFKSAVKFQEGPGIMAEDFKESGVPLLRISCIKGKYATLDGCMYLDPEKVAKKWSHFQVQLGDLLISASATMGTVTEVTDEVVGAVPYTGIIRLFPSEKINKDFLTLFVVSDLFLTQIDMLKTGSAMQHFGPYHLNQMKIILPPMKEQLAILDEVQPMLDKIDELKLNAEEAISLMKEHRVSLISDVVTGKIDVRELA